MVWIRASLKCIFNTALKIGSWTSEEAIQMLILFISPIYFPWRKQGLKVALGLHCLKEWIENPLLYKQLSLWGHPGYSPCSHTSSAMEISCYSTTLSRGPIRMVKGMWGTEKSFCLPLRKQESSLPPPTSSWFTASPLGSGWHLPIRGHTLSCECFSVRFG